MSKAHKTNAQPRENRLFPFKLLHYWIKPTPSIMKRCVRCGRMADYTCEYYLNASQIASLVTGGMNRRRAIDKVWSEDLAKQCHGKYTNYGTSDLCKDCTAKVVDSAVGRQVATVTMNASQSGRLSFILGCTLQTPQHDGVMFASVLPRSISTIEQLSLQLAKTGVDIHLNNEGRTQQ